ncbi:ABC transporter permease [Gluconacetobacter sp. Hr-1-5]|uniref:ABC transporter permease n=1 Tax=Gluconacetobacter sp. Hr-1-5 TaxID=3395370 RepID=UPI003B523580
MLSDFWRLVTRHRLYTILNVAGLALGIATFLTLSLVARYELGWERWYPGAASIYQLQADLKLNGNVMHAESLTPLLLPGVTARMPGLVATRLESAKALVSVGKSAAAREEIISFADPSFFDVFRLKFREGQGREALRGPSDIALSDEMARRYFGDASPMGKTLTIRREGHARDYVVTGVLAPHPVNTKIQTGLVAPLPDVAAERPCAEQWGYFCSETYVTLPHPGDLASFTALAHAVFATSPHAQRNDGAMGKSMTFTPIPLTATHFGHDGIANDGSSRGAMTALAIIGILALIAAGLNYINLATAQALGRAREIAIRKVLGASRYRLIARFFGEALALAFIAGLLGLALTELVVPFVVALSGWPIDVDYRESLPILLGAVLFLGMAAGSYPAFLLSSFTPAPVLAASRLPAQGRFGSRLRMVLFGIQFAFATTIGICTLVVNAQALHLRNIPRGMEVRDLLLLSTDRHDEIDDRTPEILDRLRAMPGMRAASASAGWLDGAHDVQSIFPTAKPDAAFMSITARIDADFFQTYGIPLLAGRLPDPRRGDDVERADRHQPARNVVLNLVAARKLGFSDPASAIGKTFNADGIKTIIGVVVDVTDMNGHFAPSPTAYALQGGHFSGIVIAMRTAPGALPAVLSQLRSGWPQLVPGLPFAPSTMTSMIENATREDVARGKLFTLGAGVTIAIACLGLYGLAAFNAERRMHEIGIRKTLGATAGQVLRLMLFVFLRPVLYASLVAWPLAWLFMRNWLSGFENRIALTPLYFILTTLLAGILCALTVLGRSLALARAEPARALRAE